MSHTFGLYFNKKLIEYFLYVSVPLYAIVYLSTTKDILYDSISGGLNAKGAMQLVVYESVKPLISLIVPCFFLALSVVVRRMWNDGNLRVLVIAGLNKRTLLLQALPSVLFFAGVLILLTVIVQPYAETKKQELYAGDRIEFFSELIKPRQWVEVRGGFFFSDSVNSSKLENVSFIKFNKSGIHLVTANAMTLEQRTGQLQQDSSEARIHELFTDQNQLQADNNPNTQKALYREALYLKFENVYAFDYSQPDAINILGTDTTAQTISAQRFSWEIEQLSYTKNITIEDFTFVFMLFSLALLAISMGVLSKVTEISTVSFLSLVIYIVYYVGVRRSEYAMWVHLAVSVIGLYLIFRKKGSLVSS